VKSFGGVRAVDDVSLDILPGELFFLLGPSGCGKTTLLRCVAGFYEPDAGTISIGERDVTRIPPHRRDTGMVFQSYALWPHLSVRENVAFGLEMRGVPKGEIRPRVEDALALVRMSERADARPNQLSGGQQQRIALARALVVRPQCLLLDEPLSNLDAKLRLNMRTEIRRICKEAGLTAVYVTHDQKEALSIADRLAVLDAGRVCQVGAPWDVYRHPVDPFVANFIGETNFLDGVVLGAEGEWIRVRTPMGELRGRSTASVPPEPGASVRVSIRPESIRLGGDAGGVNRFDGTVHDTVYLGEVAQHRVAVAGAEGGEVDLHAFELNPRLLAREGAAPAPLSVDPGDVVVLRSGGAAP